MGSCRFDLLNLRRDYDDEPWNEKLYEEWKLCRYDGGDVVETKKHQAYNN